MPTYEFVCLDCGKSFEIFASIRAKEEGLVPSCEFCGSKHTKQAITGFLFSTGQGSMPATGSGSGTSCSGCSGRSCSGCN